MNKKQKLVQEQFLNNEEAIIARLKQTYHQSLADIKQKTKELQDQILGIDTMINLVGDDPEGTLQSMKQSKIYQKQYQDALNKQISSILDNMQVEEFKTVDAYLKQCYEDGFIGTMFDLQGQGIPLCFPLDQESMVTAVQLDSKISEGLYSKMGVDVNMLKGRIAGNVSRGISSGMTFQQIAQQIDGSMNIGFNKAVRIARTEGHRIQVQSGMDACYKAKDAGADVVKQWDSSLDNKTRPSHRKVDGEIRELDEPFSNGLMFPGDPDGGASEVVNCRCALLQRSKWALDDEELETLKERAKYFGLDKTDNFKEYKTKYLKATEKLGNASVTPQQKTKKTDVLSYTDDQSNAIEYYVSGDGQWINQYLRGNGDFGDLSDFEEVFLKDLTSATDRMLSDDIKQLFRSVDAKAIFGDMTDLEFAQMIDALGYDDKFAMKKIQSKLDNAKGKVITEKGFMSTTKDYDVANEWGDFTGSDMPVVLEFDNVPKGLKGADLKKFDIEGDEQFEVLLARNTKYKIDDIYYKDGRIHVKASFVDDTEDMVKASKTKKPVANVLKSSIMKSKWDNGLEPQGHLTGIDTDDLYQYTSDLLGVPKEKATDYIDSTLAYSDDYYSDIRRYQTGRPLKDHDAETIKAISENIEEFIEKSPRWNGGETFRGWKVTDEQLESYEVGGVLDMGGTASWTSELTIAEDFAKNNVSYERPNSVIFHCPTQGKATSIRHASIYEGENEVLCSKESKYQIERMEKAEDGIVHIYVKEVDE